MSSLPFVRLETHGTCRAEMQDALVVEHGSMRVIELPPVVGVLAALVIAGCLLFIAHDGGEPASPAMGAAPVATSQG